MRCILFGFISGIILSYPLIGGQVCMLCVLLVLQGVGCPKQIKYCKVEWVEFISCIILSYPPIGGQVCML